MRYAAFMAQKGSHSACPRAVLAPCPTPLSGWPFAAAIFANHLLQVLPCAHFEQGHHAGAVGTVAQVHSVTWTPVILANVPNGCTLAMERRAFSSRHRRQPWR